MINTLKSRGYEETNITFSSDWETPPNVTKLGSTKEIKILETKIRDRDTVRDDFIFFADRLIRILIEKALDLIPFEDKIVKTPTGADYSGKSIFPNICGVSIMRAGDTMVQGLRSVLKDAEVGSILIQSDDKKVPRVQHKSNTHNSYLHTNYLKR